MTSISIRTEAPDHRDQVRAVVAEAFGQPGEADLVERLHADGDVVVSLVAMESEQIVGHVMLSTMQAPLRALGLAPVSVAPAWQGTGVGSALIREAIRLAREVGYTAIFVLGDQDYYGRFGFDVEAARGFACPYAGDHFAVLELEPLSVREGAVDYAPAFAAL